MKYFKLPDLGEGLPEAEIVKWHVAVGDKIQTDQLLVEVETAKAIVEVPSPCDGTIVALFGAEGDVIHTGEPLVEFDNEASHDTGTVVGKLQQAEISAGEDHFIVGAAPSSLQVQHGRATPAVRALAQRLNVNLDQVTPGPHGLISAAEVEKAAQLDQQHGSAEPLKGVRRAMAHAMTHSHSQVVPVTLHDDADIHDWPAGTDITMRLVQALAVACRKNPALNAWFDGNTMSRRLRQSVDLGIAVDTEEGLFVPVLRDVANRSQDALREGLNQLREDVAKRTIPPAEMQGATITLSNFGTIAGRYASPIVVPPQVAIVGAGVIREEVVARQQQIAIRRLMPLSITFDHRAVTGGEAARFLKTLIMALQKATP
ncbi:MAG: 2-oxo acid dehydrogenase subunit E2 [Hahellaceae bacterium]|nr:2-oxo acid dehydrogenase subunit E2 [Hahellaceae bacterium]MCP5168394.1 2-oxo acid dehydrogenase subunit E2 [Hahellaceae bacterium]